MTPLQTQELPSGEAVDAAPQHAWITYRNDRFGFAIDYPADVFAVDDRTLGDFWRLFVSHDGRARLLVTAGFNGKRLSTASYRQAVLDETYQGASVEYAPLRKTWFVLAGSRGEEGFYERATFACDGRIIHRWRLTYPARERDTYSKIIEQNPPGLQARARCWPALRLTQASSIGDIRCRGGRIGAIRLTPIAPYFSIEGAGRRSFRRAWSGRPWSW